MTLIEQLKRDEGCILHAYQDSRGFWTIGYGQLIDARKGGSIPQEIADAMLAIKVSAVIQELQTALPWIAQLDPVRRAALQNMAFNLGVPGLLEFRNTLSLVKMGEYAEAAKAMLQSLWADQVGDRAKRLAKQMETGEWQ